MSIKRGIGYCEVEICAQYLKGNFIINYGSEFGGYYCPDCRMPGVIVPELARVRSSNPVFKEVRIQYDYSTGKHKYRGLVVLRDEELPEDSNVYELDSPIIRTETRAYKLAQSILANLDYTEPDEDMRVSSVEHLVSLDKNGLEWEEQLNLLVDRLSKSRSARLRNAHKKEIII